MAFERLGSTAAFAVHLAKNIWRLRGLEAPLHLCVVYLADTHMAFERLGSIAAFAVHLADTHMAFQIFGSIAAFAAHLANTARRLRDCLKYGMQPTQLEYVQGAS